MSHIRNRILKLNDKPVLEAKSCVIYVMSRDQRLADNYALQVAQEQAIRLEVPLAVAFCLYPAAGKRSREHYEFMLAGLQLVEAELAKKNIAFIMLLGDGERRLKGLLGYLKPQAVIFDFNPLRGPRRLHRQIADIANCSVAEVDTHNIVPVWTASDHQEIAARTLRPKLKRQLATYLETPASVRRHPHDWPGTVQTMVQLKDRIAKLTSSLRANGSDISRFKPGEKAAAKALKEFVGERLEGYAEQRNNPTVNGQSELNPYLHFGQLSSAQAVRAVLEAVGERPALQADADAFIEEITIRKELSDNFCWYNEQYDQLAAAPEWARRTLDKHANDEREFVYELSEFEAAQTHDEAWNAAQRQLVRTGKIHGYMRMYWAKKVLEWSSTPQRALETLLYLNDFYHIDGGDPNGYVGILWSIAGLHDRPWGERPVYGVVRSMVYSGLKRKFDVQAYIDMYPAA